MTTRIYDAKQMAQIAKFYEGLTDLMKEFEGGDLGGFVTEKNPLYIYGMEIIIRHKDDYTVGRISMDDFPFFELTDENYVSEADEVRKAHTRQQDTAAGQSR